MLVLVLLLLLFLAGCEGTGEDGDVDTALLSIRIGGGGATAQQQGVEAPLSPVIPRQQESDAIPVEVTEIRLRVNRAVSVGGTRVPADSNIDIPIDISQGTATLMLEIDANTPHVFIIEALNEQGMVIFDAVELVNVSSGPQTLAIDLMAVSPGPTVVNQIEDIPLFAEFVPPEGVPVELTEVFFDDNGEVLTLTAMSNNEALVTTEVTGQTATVIGTMLLLSIRPEEESSSALITVTATDESGNQIDALFFVTVTVRPLTGAIGE